MILSRIQEHLRYASTFTYLLYGALTAEMFKRHFKTVKHKFHCLFAVYRLIIGLIEYVKQTHFLSFLIFKIVTHKFHCLLAVYLFIMGLLEHVKQTHFLSFLIFQIVHSSYCSFTSFFKIICSFSYKLNSS